MDNNKKSEFTVAGFTFGSATDVELAQTELSAIQYIEKKIENRNADTVLSVYQGAIERKLFRTPVGYAYLHDLQRRMKGMGVDIHSIPGIPLMQVYNSVLDVEEKPRRSVAVPKKVKRDALRQQNNRLKIAVVVLSVLLVLLFIISLNGSTPTILNYKHVVQNEYSEWSDELTARERAVREKEKDLNIDNSLYENRLDTE